LPLEHQVHAHHIRPATDLAERVLLPGDPAHALAAAQALLEPPPKMFNHARGLWGYTGIAADGEPLTVQATGLGGPSAAIVCEELIALGATRLVGIGTCAALGPELARGSLLAVESVLPADGTSVALGADAPLAPDRDLLERLVGAGARPATVASSDLFYDPRDGAVAGWVESGALAVEMVAAAILQVAARRGLPAACVLGVTEVPASNGARPMSPDELGDLAVRVGEAGYAALRNP